MARRRHGEHAVILTVLTADIGLLSGVVPGGTSPRRAALLQPGNSLSLDWRSRLQDGLGTFSAEPSHLRTGLLADGLALAGVNAVAGLIVWALAERDPHPQLAAATEALLDRMDAGSDWAADYVRWELLLLSELGFGLSLDRCAVSGLHEGLAWVSPRTGHAVTHAAAGGWADRLLPLPPFLTGNTAPAADDLAAGLRLSGHFLDRALAQQTGRAVPAARGRLAARLATLRPGPACPAAPQDPRLGC